MYQKMKFLVVLQILILTFFISTIGSSVATGESKTVVRISKLGDQQIFIELLEGQLKVKSGPTISPVGPGKPATLILTKDQITDEFAFEQGMQILIGKGDVKLKDKLYPEGTKIIVGKDGNFIQGK